MSSEISPLVYLPKNTKEFVVLVNVPHCEIEFPVIDHPVTERLGPLTGVELPRVLIPVQAEVLKSQPCPPQPINDHLVASDISKYKSPFVLSDVTFNHVTIDWLWCVSA